jgi:hypothetical protein
MRDTLVRFFTIDPLNEQPLIYWGLAVVWLVLVGNCIASLRVQPISVAARWLWAFLIIALPIIGMALYLLRCLFKADYSFLKFIMGPPARVRKGQPN